MDNECQTSFAAPETSEVLKIIPASTTRSASLYEPPLDMFGADAVERWFTEEEVEEVVAFANRLAV
jgi:hypothetical protein